MHEGLHTRKAVQSLYVSRKEGGRKLASIEDSVDESIRLEDYKDNHEGRQITATRIDTNKTMDNRLTITKKQKWEEKQLYGRFKQRINHSKQQKT